MSGFGNKLSSYSMTQLNELLEDDGKLDNIVQEMEEVLEVQRSKETTLAGNRTLAEQNLGLQPQLDCQKNELTKRYRSLQELFESYQLRKSTLDQSAGSGSLDTLLALLQAEGAKIEEETENMADSFLEGEMSLDAFIESYQSKRKLAHQRRVKIEKLQEMVVSGQRIPSGPPVLPAHVTESSPAPDIINGSPVPQPRRAPPPPPSQPVPAIPQPTALPYPIAPYPPIPPRAAHSPGYPSPAVPYIPQYPPALPQRAPPRMVPQPGFIMQ